METELDLFKINKKNYNSLKYTNQSIEKIQNSNRFFILSLFFVNIFGFIFIILEINHIKKQINEIIIYNFNILNAKIDYVSKNIINDINSLNNNNLNDNNIKDYDGEIDIDYKKIREIINEEENESLRIIIEKILEKNNQISNKNESDVKLEENNILTRYIKEQNDFCNNPNKYYNKLIEDKIKLKTIKINGILYQMYVYRDNNFMMNEFIKYDSFETKESINMLKALQYYAMKKNITNNKDIYMLDIGGNIGWYPTFLGRYGYSILSFEPFEINYYIAKKNYCYLNRNSNIIIITKGIHNKEMICDYYAQNDNSGNGMIVCDKDSIKNENLSSMFIKNKKVELTKLSNFIPYLSDKNLAIIKVDIEGAEEKAIESGIEFITKYHIPFIFIEFSPTYLQEHGTDPRKFAQLFVDNGYKISLDGFINNTYITIDELMRKAGFQVNCYFIHKDIIDNK